jgi:hypothetical protein
MANSVEDKLRYFGMPSFGQAAFGHFTELRPSAGRGEHTLVGVELGSRGLCPDEGAKGLSPGLKPYKR